MFVSPRSKLACRDGAYLPMIWLASVMPGSLLLTVGLFTYVDGMTFDRSAPPPAAASMKRRLPETLPTNVAWRVQPTFVAVTSAVIAGVGVAKIASTSAPLLLSARICCVRLVAVASYDSASTMLLFLAPRPERRPA